MDETLETIISQIKDEEEQLRFKRRWLLGCDCEPQNLTPEPGKPEFIPESLLREDDVFYDTVTSRVEEAFGCYTDEQVCVIAEESNLSTKDVVRKLDMSLDCLTNKGLYLITTIFTGGSSLFGKTRQNMKKIIRESISRDFTDSEAEVVKQVHRVLSDPRYLPEDCTEKPSFQSQHDAAMKVLNELEKLSTQTLLAMNRKLKDSRTMIPRLKVSKSGLSRSKLINQVKKAGQKMLSQAKEDKLQEPLAKAMSLVGLSYRLSPGGDKTAAAATEFFHFSTETKKLQNEIVKALWLLDKVRFPKLKSLHLLLDPEAEVSNASLRSAVKKMLIEYLFECSDIDTIPKSLLKALSLVNGSSRSNVGHRVIPREAIKEETECILNVSAQVKQILWQCTPDVELQQDFDDAYMEDLEDSDDDENCCIFFDDAIKDDPRSLSVTPTSSKSTPPSDNQGEQKNKNQYLALQEISDETALVAHNLIGRLLEKFADQKHLDLKEDERSYLGGKSRSQEDIEVSEEKQDKSDESIMVSAVKESMPSLDKSVLRKLKELLK